ncbi:MAG: hypothetical protein ACRDHP_11410 [Ktedonobacterales bacterium]
MSYVFEVSDAEYAAIKVAAQERGQAPDEYFRSWVQAVVQQTECEEIDPDQAWFWTPEWQAKEREADAALAAGDYTRYETDEEFLAALDDRSPHANS